MSTFQKYRQEAVTSLELMLGSTNSLIVWNGDEEPLAAETGYAAKGTAALETARNPESSAEQWMEAAELIEQCYNLATNAEYAGIEDSIDEDHTEAIENCCEWARQKALEAGWKSRTAAA